MNKKDLIEIVSKNHGVNRSQAAEIVDTIFDSITQSLKMGKAVWLPGFGRFIVRRRAARMGRNPRTGAALKISTEKRTVFLAAGRLRAAMQTNGDGDHTGDHGAHLEPKKS